MIDLLKMISMNEINEHEADDIVDHTTDDWHSGKLKCDINKYLQFSVYEWEAYLKGADLLTLTKWRYNGWPEVCSTCKRAINFEKDIWVINDNQQLVCLKCIDNK